MDAVSSGRKLMQLPLLPTWCPGRLPVTLLQECLPCQANIICRSQDRELRAAVRAMLPKVWGSGTGSHAACYAWHQIVPTCEVSRCRCASARPSCRA